MGTNAGSSRSTSRPARFREFLYVLDSRSNGISEILAVNDHQFLVLERDGRVGGRPVKQIFLITLHAPPPTSGA